MATDISSGGGGGGGDVVVDDEELLFHITNIYMPYPIIARPTNAKRKLMTFSKNWMKPLQVILTK